MNKVERYYDNANDEWERLERHKLEFEITKRVFCEFIPSNATVLDVGGGPGRYSVLLAGKGHEVTLVDLSSEHVNQALDNAASFGVKLNACIKANALHLDEHFPEQQFDVVLCMGPLYHLPNECDRKVVIKQCLRTLKPGGIFIAAFISAFAPLVDCLKYCLSRGVERVAEELNYLQDGRYAGDSGFTEAYFIHPETVDQAMEGFEIEKLRLMAVEPLGALCELHLNQLPEEQFQKVVEVLYKIAEQKSVLGACEHLLYIGRKNR